MLTAISLTALSACSAISAQEQAEPIVPAALQTTDRSIADEKLQAALESKVSGEATRWQNPTSGVSGSVTPLKTWKTTAGTYCRSYSEKIKLASGQSLNRRGVACRTPADGWQST